MIPLFAGCLGRATPPNQVKLTQQQNEVLGKFARQVGADEINILLKDPKDPVLPGIPVGDLLYILANVGEDKLIRLVKGIGARVTLELILDIKRVGCTRYESIYPGNNFDATNTNSINNCTWEHLHVPNLMVQLLNGTSANGIITLIDTVKHSYTNLSCPSNNAPVPPVNAPFVPVVGNLATNEALCPSTTPTTATAVSTVFDTTQYKVRVDHYKFLMKLAYIVVGFDTPTGADPNLSGKNLIGPPKLYGLMNLALDGRDMVFLLDSFDKSACPAPAPNAGACVGVDALNVVTTTAPAGNIWQDISAATPVQMQELQNLLDVISKVTDTTKMGILVNGRRTARYNTTEDDQQIRYFIDRLKVVVARQTNCVATDYPVSTAIEMTAMGIPVPLHAAFQANEQALQDISVPQGGVTPATRAAAWNTKLATLINLIGNVTRMMDLIYGIDDGYDLNHISPFTCASLTAGNSRGIDNLMVMVNNLNNTPNNHVNDLTGYNPPYTNLLPNIENNELITAAYLIDNVALDPTNNNPAKRNKVKYLIEYIGNSLSVLRLSCYSAVADNNPISTNTCVSRGLINQIADGSKLDDASLVDLTAGGKKLASMLDPTTGVTEIEDMRFVIRNVSMSNLNGMLKGLLISGTAKTANLINQITGNDCWGENFGAIHTIIDAPGAGYTSPPAVSFGTGSGASAKAVIETDNINFPATYRQVKDVIVINSGIGYPSAPLPTWITLTGGGGAGALVHGLSGTCRYNAGTGEFRGFPSAIGTGATGLGKMVNVINFITGSPKTVVDLINGVNDGQQLGIMINGITRSSNLVGVLNATLDANRNNHATLTDMINLLNSISRADTYKLVHMMDALGDANEVSLTATVPGGDHDMVAQLIAPYARTGNLVNGNSGVGYATMASLVSSLSMTGGGGYTNGATITGPGSLNALINVATVNAVTGTFINNPGAGCTSVPTITLTGGGGGTGAVLVPYMSGGQVSRINILNSGSGYTAAPIVSFTGGGCTTTPLAVSHINGIGTITITNGGGPYTDNNLNPTPGALTISGGGAGAALSVTVSGAIAAAGLGGYTPGTGYVTGQVCPISGAGGNGGTCTVTATAGALSGCSAIAGGGNYGVGRIVKIGGQAQVIANLNTVTGAVTSYTVVNGGCGYLTTPVVTVTNTTGCTTVPVPGAVTMNASNGVATVGLGTAGLGCPNAIKVIIGEAAYAYHSDGATAIVSQVTGGKVTSISVSNASVNAAQLVQLLDRDSTGTGIALNYRADDPAWTPTSACSASGLVPTAGVPCVATDTLRPNISTREAMIRLLHHGVTPTTTSSKAFFNGTGGIGPGTLSMDWPGVGPQHIAGAILNNVTSSATQSLISLMNSDVISLEDTIILLGCGDRVAYSNGWVANSWLQLCSAVGQGIW